MLAERDPQLEGEQLVELQAFDGPRQLVGVLGEVHAAKGRVEILQLLGLDQLGRHRVGDRRQLLERGEHELADRPRRDAFRGAVDRSDPPGVHQVSLLATEDLRLLVPELETAPISGDGARDRDLETLLVDPGRPRLVEVRQVEVAGAVGDRDGHHRPALPGQPLVRLVDAGDHGCLLSDPEVADALHGRAVDVATRVVAEEIAHRSDAHAGEDEVGFVAFVSEAGPTSRQLPVHEQDRSVERESRRRGGHFRERFYHPV